MDSKNNVNEPPASPAFTNPYSTEFHSKPFSLFALKLAHDFCSLDGVSYLKAAYTKKTFYLGNGGTAVVKYNQDGLPCKKTSYDKNKLKDGFCCEYNLDGSKRNEKLFDHGQFDWVFAVQQRYGEFKSSSNNPKEGKFSGTAEDGTQVTFDYDRDKGIGLLDEIKTNAKGITYHSMGMIEYNGKESVKKTGPWIKWDENKKFLVRKHYTGKGPVLEKRLDPTLIAREELRIETLYKDRCLPETA